MKKKETVLNIEGFEIPIKQVFCKQPALYLNVETRNLHGEYPLTSTKEDMEAFCREKIKKVLAYYEYTKQWICNNPFTFEEGEVEYILGNYYQLNINVDSTSRQKIEMDEENKKINLTIRCKENVSKYLDKYFRHLLKNYIQEIIPELEDVLDVKSSGFKIGKLKDAYGCCNKDGFLKFDPILYRKSKEAVKTVVLHELCHIKEFNHKGEFFELMEKVIPNWKKWDSKLRLAFPEIVIK
ncbi:YgjP-like metallopeptidase domain-containing protein [Treponema sp.]|uniref:YgjP-like metallopeptidase domain-containing protein n=1 Tax=Treponema sp. TaxID=166 RepID=UPI002A80FB1F|nr:YgjP-like metallopeptidase domain-containing protein [Treponema sp.]MCI6442952.1 M48 family metallopeptidase [Spirochaetia bacterium]MDY4133582.1 YgjP-like metallopeptidase domain-containing protein [Treponema sp.]